MAHPVRTTTRRKLTATFLAFSVLAFSFTSTQEAHAVNKPKVMFMTSAYGVMIGSLSGLATLAFYESPGARTRNVALGASLGLYVGIGLGIYMIYLKEDPNAPQEAAPAAEEESSQIKILNPSMKVVDHSAATYIILSPSLTVDPRTKTPLLGLSALF